MGWGIGLGRGLLRGTCGIVFLLVCGLVVVAFLGRVSWWEIMEAEGKGRERGEISLHTEEAEEEEEEKCEGGMDRGREMIPPGRPPSHIPYRQRRDLSRK